MDLSEAMEQLAIAIAPMPVGPTVEVNVMIETNDDVPPLFVEHITDDNGAVAYRRVIETKDGVVTKAIVLWIRD